MTEYIDTMQNILQNLDEGTNAKYNYKKKYTKQAIKQIEILKNQYNKFRLNDIDDLNDISQYLNEITKGKHSWNDLPMVKSELITIYKIIMLQPEIEKIPIEEEETKDVEKINNKIDNYLKLKYGKNYQYEIIKMSLSLQAPSFWGNESPEKSYFLNIYQVNTDDAIVKNILNSLK